MVLANPTYTASNLCPQLSVYMPQAHSGCKRWVPF